MAAIEQLNAAEEAEENIHEVSEFIPYRASYG